ncbi:MAG: competence/damage-inducible protein A [Acidobacteria bacterium]|jgi:nicotinamide-nucleotide amidase|nr:MAG: competence/damage-inducible protein A [Acidobacteriota bacterium]GIU81680.1 MAG: CinA-like protein [Pyrinomonadaceae bacterium]
MQKAEIIAIGSELLTPDKIDTNSLWFTQKLNEIGIEVIMKAVVGDDIELLKQAINSALKRSDVIILTGGLGPTEDDVTRQAVAEALGRKLIFNEEVARQIKEKFARMNRQMPEINKRQAFVVEGAVILENPNGTAVGMFIELNEKSLAVLPGPPRENQPMFEKDVLPRLGDSASGVVFRRRLLRVSGMGESAVDEAIAPIYSKYENIRTSILFNRSEIEIHLTAKAKSQQEADEALEKLASEITEKLGIAVFALNGETMEEVVGRLLKERRKTLAVAESCTGGLIGARLTDIAGASEYFLLGVTAYANEAKIKMLDVPSELIKRHGAVSAEVAEAMASGVRKKAGSDYGISVTGIAGPSGGTKEKPVGLVFIGYSDETETKSFKVILPGDRYLIRWRASQAALDYLRRKILHKEKI